MDKCATKQKLEISATRDKLRHTQSLYDGSQADLISTRQQCDSLRQELSKVQFSRGVISQARIDAEENLDEGRARSTALESENTKLAASVDILSKRLQLSEESGAFIRGRVTKYKSVRNSDACFVGMQVLTALQDCFAWKAA